MPVLGLKLTKPKSKEDAFMINSIQHFQEQGAKKLTEIFSHYALTFHIVCVMKQAGNFS